jgi:TatD DNase family protein
MVFDRMLALAVEMKLPLVIHSRNRPAEEAGKEGVPEDAIADILAALTDAEHAGTRFVMHFFSGSVEQAEKVVAAGGYISVTHMRSKERRKVINTVPLDRLLVESDSPYVGRTPESVRDAVAYIAEAKGLSVEQVAEATAANARRFFGF